jgi:platelet-activating factor acetylhydrolase
MVPLQLLQSLRIILIHFGYDSFWVQRTITGLSLAIVAVGSVLAILFPAVQLPRVNGPYHVGVVDCFLPVDDSIIVLGPSERRNGIGGRLQANGAGYPLQAQSHVSARLFYPTLEAPRSGIPQLNPGTAVEYCRQMMRFGAPPPLKSLGWMLHTWRLARLPVKRNALLAPSSSGRKASARFPVVVQSHGLGGTCEVYAYQSLQLASQGNVVVFINHTDRSAPVVPLRDGSLLTYDYDVRKLDENEYVRHRRRCALYRAKEMLAAARYLSQLESLPSDASLNESLQQFVGRLDTDRFVFFGHSFGAATALTAAFLMPDIAQAVVAHDPAGDWIPDDVRASLLASSRSVGMKLRYSGGTGGYMDLTPDPHHAARKSTIHQLNLLFLYSEEWVLQNWESIRVIRELHEKGRLGKPDGVSSYDVILGTHHLEFSDTSMLTPVWLGRASGTCGKRNPCETALEIALKTRAFIDAARKQDEVTVRR